MRIFEGYQKGINLGGWISQFATYDHEHFRTFITEKDIADIAAMGFDHVRVPVDYNVLEDEEGNRLESGYDYLRSCHEWCLKHNLHMLIDLHECYGYSFDPLKVGMDRKIFFYDEKLQERFLNLWAQIAEAFKDDPEMVAFEALNEVVLFEVTEPWNLLIRKFVKTVRAICPNHYLVIGGARYNHVTSVPLLENHHDDKIVYNFHCYEPILFTHQGAYWFELMPSDFRISYTTPLEEYRKKTIELLEMTNGSIFEENAAEMGPGFFETSFRCAVEKAEQDNVPLYCGEYGTIDLANNEDKIQWLRDIHIAFKKCNIGHALWNYKGKDFGIVDEAFASIKDEFITYI